MGELAERNPNVRVIAAVGTSEIERQVRSLLSHTQNDMVEWIDIGLSKPVDLALSAPNTIAPVKRIARLRNAERLISKVDLVVSPERTCLAVKRRLTKRKKPAPPFVFVPHGAGDRSVTYHPALADFDWFLVSGKKVEDEFVAHGIARREQCRVTGYAKFDAVRDTPRKQLFANDNPVIVYNPHFDPALSSWYDHGPDFLSRIAAAAERFNCIFAPHVMLFKKSFHVSLEYRTARRRPNIPDAVRYAENILIDIGSSRLFDMTYTSAADIYVGDVSSQVYEFLRKPGPCVFIDAARQGPDAYQFWQNGRVVEDAAAATAALDNVADWSSIYCERQRTLFDYTMSVDPEQSASLRGAMAIEEILTISN